MESFVTFGIFYRLKQKYPHIKGMKDIASATFKYLKKQIIVYNINF